MSFFAGAAVLALLAASSQDGTYLLGELRVEALVWELGLDVRAGDDGPTVLFDDISRWSLGVPLEGFTAAEGEVAFELPDLGRVEGLFEEGRLEGLVTLEDGRVGTLDLVAVEPPRVRSEELTLESEGVTLGATLGLPHGEGPFPAVVFVHGGGDSIRTGDAPSTTAWWNVWYALVLDHDPLPSLSELEIPMLWLFGARDSQSDPVRNVTVLSELARDQHKDYTIHVFPGAGHGIMVPMDAAGNGLPPMTMATGYFQILVDWIRDATADG